MNIILKNTVVFKEALACRYLRNIRVLQKYIGYFKKTAVISYSYKLTLECQFNTIK